MTFSSRKARVLRREGRQIRAFRPSVDRLQDRMLLSGVPLADGSVAYVNSAQQLYDIRRNQQILETGGVASMDPLPGGKVALLLANDQVETYDGSKSQNIQPYDIYSQIAVAGGFRYGLSATNQHLPEVGPARGPLGKGTGIVRTLQPTFAFIKSLAALP